MKKKFIILSIITVLVISVFSIIITIAIKKHNAKFDYQIENVTEINYMLFCENNKYGVISKTGEVVVEPRYDEIQIPNPSKPLFICMYNYDTSKKQYNIKVLNEKSEQILYQYVIVEAIKLNSGISNIPYEKSVLKFSEKGKYGLIDFEGKVIVKAVYDSIESFDYNEGLLLVKKEDKYGVININGAVVIKEKYDKIESDGYYEGGVGYKKSGYITGIKEGSKMKYGYINSDRKQLLKEEFEQVARISAKGQKGNVYIVAFKNGKAGLYKNKDIIIKHEYEDIAYEKNNNCLILQKDSKQGIVDLNGKTIIPIKYDNIYISGKYINAQTGSNVDIFKYPNNEKIQLDNVVGLNQTLNEKYTIAITKDEKYIILDNDNKKLESNEYKYLEYIYNNYFIAYKNDKFGVVDSDGNNIVEFKYDIIQKVSNSNILQALDVTKSITDLIIDGELIVSMEHAEVYFEESYIVIQSNSDRKYVSYDGKIVDNTDIFEKQLYAYTQDGKWGFVNKDGDVILNAQYDFVTELNEYGFAGIKKDNKWRSN